jgi:hypothetical protein
MQTYASHRRFIPIFHFFALPLFGINIIVQIVVAVRQPTALNIWNFVVALALLALAMAARRMATTAQDRIIRLEETLRLQRLLPPDLLPRVNELTTDQLVGLRFCADDELPELCRAVFSGDIRGREEIKKRIKTWRPDTLRV